MRPFNLNQDVALLAILTVAFAGCNSGTGSSGPSPFEIEKPTIILGKATAEIKNTSTGDKGVSSPIYGGIFKHIGTNPPYSKENPLIRYWLILSDEKINCNYLLDENFGGCCGAIKNPHTKESVIYRWAHIIQEGPWDDSTLSIGGGILIQHSNANLSIGRDRGFLFDDVQDNQPFGFVHLVVDDLQTGINGEKDVKIKGDFSVRKCF